MEKAKKLHRFAANLIDYVLLNAVLTVAGNIFGFAFGLIAGLSGMGEDGFVLTLIPLIFIVMYVGIYFYYVYFPMKFGGQTLGKKALKLHIVREDGQELTTKTLVVREMIGKSFLTSILLGFPLLLIFGKKRQCMHDKMVKTIVVSEK